MAPDTIINAVEALETITLLKKDRIQGRDIPPSPPVNSHS
ncbi:hypothetical protein KR50_35460 [Jeotgalibacillus campisalis]|uniref:Uncharacterized protein n=1 Tax=Jeotgalibacillus campisalis TaxID=220754 RepID=A0A0C2VGL4_9BACL|nr:hypothetical protein KR50_35460 [Jeotgalibacillus campisalis]